MQVVNDELVQLMGGEVSDLVFAKSGPTIILLAGLQGVGKTTVCAKLAFYLKKMVLSLSLYFNYLNIFFFFHRLLVLIDQSQITGQELYASCCRCLQACCY